MKRFEESFQPPSVFIHPLHLQPHPFFLGSVFCGVDFPPFPTVGLTPLDSLQCILIKLGAKLKQQRTMGLLRLLLFTCLMQLYNSADEMVEG